MYGKFSKKYKGCILGMRILFQMHELTKEREREALRLIILLCGGNFDDRFQTL